LHSFRPASIPKGLERAGGENKRMYQSYSVVKSGFATGFAPVPGLCGKQNHCNFKPSLSAITSMELFYYNVNSIKNQDLIQRCFTEFKILTGCI